MPFQILLLAHRKPTLSPTTFHTYYESHIELLKRVTGSDFPLSHRRSYIARTTTTTNTPPSPTSVEEASHPATLLLGQQSNFPFDAIAELTFEDRAAFERFTAKIQEPENKRLIEEDEERWSDGGGWGLWFWGRWLLRNDNYGR
ncbi:hypothetical protein BO94DRAFT_574830 [Aspergillus sclerotioniger CBS 115572]|uniref:EthD domain-containing protein n=1 Tax=Aspergillus sclerotioniger CBS 115572 TaxID=1450535 RepID=A0A317WQW3_9EURO|nr:hypothetical protein BO94DRAFT_574830 [Aspergillus sclerotioniger CBS 115572]PWY88823.1 hypothetical protein BO94DRAFT_574830 [Aspergillus sclerotioniger CBS 115572]